MLLKVLAAGVCHSDLHIWDGYYDIGGGKKLMLTDRGIKLPLTMGHENVGEVVASGRTPRASRSATCGWSIRGSAAANARCASAARKISASSRRISACSRNGGYATHMLVPHPRYLFDIGDMPPERAAPLACSGVTAYGALKKVGRRCNEEPVVIIGAGGVGLMGVDACTRKMGGQGRHRGRHRSRPSARRRRRPARRW